MEEEEEEDKREKQKEKQKNKKKICLKKEGGENSEKATNWQR